MLALWLAAGDYTILAWNGSLAAGFTLPGELFE